MNTRKIKVVFGALAGDSPRYFWNDYGTRIQIKCHQKIERISRTRDGVKCVNWELMDSFGIGGIYEGSTRVHKFYRSVNWRGIGLWLISKYFLIQNL